MIALLKKNGRFIFVSAMLLVLPVVLVARMLMLQVFDLEGGVTFLRGQGDARTIREEVIPANRGMILDRNGQPLAVSTPVVSIWANPRHMVITEESLAALSGKMDIPLVELREKFGRNRDKQFLYLKRHLSPMDAEAILSLQIPGIYGQEEYRRFYPSGEVAANLIGYTNIDDVGQEGFELAYNDWLQGRPGSKQVVKDLYQRTIKNLRQVSDPKPGKDVTLSIDLRLQHCAYRALKTAVTHHRASSGSVVVLDVQTGEILAMVNQPSFNPNDRAGIRMEGIRNRAMIDIFEPGSTMKPLTMVAALESGKYRPESRIDTTPGFIRVANKTFMDPVNYGVIDLTHVITKSSQVGTTKIALSLEHEKLVDVFHRLGIGQYAGTGFPGESAGYLPVRTRWSPVEKATFAFGYGLSVTALQLAQAYAVFASNGVKKPISLLRVDSSPQGEQVVSEKVADQVLAMLETVTGPQGTAKKAAIATYRVAGKTGTTHKVGRGGYEYGKYISIFAGVAPVQSPRIVTVVVIDDPKGREYFGGEVTAPVFAEVVSDSLRIMNVAPDKLPSSNGNAMLAQGVAR